MSNSLEWKRTHFTHFPAPTRKMRFKTIAERDKYLAKMAKKREKRKSEKASEAVNE